MQLQQAFIRRLTEAIGADRASVALSALEQPASASIRLNAYKRPAGELAILEGATKVPWAEEGFSLPSRPVFTLQPLFHAGAYYVQDSSAMFVGHAFRQAASAMGLKAPLRVLDLCAAPGGKTTDLANSLRAICGDDFLLVANEVMRNRATILADNVARWGDPNVVVTNSDPKAFASLPGWFDVIVADVPCSGEGMFRKDEEALAQWSEDNVALCASRQRRILADVWPALAEGGMMIYSTCTFNREENDLNAKWICEELGAVRLALPPQDEAVIRTEYGYGLVPGFVPGEGQYCSCLKKTSAKPATAPGRDARNDARNDGKYSGLASLFSIPVSVKARGELLIAVPSRLAPLVERLSAVASVVASGCAAGTMKGKDFIPDEDLALSAACRHEAFAVADVDEKTALAFLHKDAIVLPDSPRGIVMLRHAGLGLGFVKNLGNRTNSLHPQARRIRMDI